MQINVNGIWITISEENRVLSLLEFLRDELGLTGTRYGCGIAQCGACTVLIDSIAVRSCITPVDSLSGKSVTTIEGLSSGVASDALHPIQKAFERNNVPQCGFCMSGQIITIASLYEMKPRPPKHVFERALEGNLCRCGTYSRIRKALDELLGDDS